MTRRLLLVSMSMVIAASASADISRFTPSDPRLDKKITLSVSHAKLEDVAKSLSEQTGTTIKAGTGARDWKARERRVTIHVKDMPAGKILDKTADLLGFCLSREGKDKEWSYVIWQDKKSRDHEVEMLNAEREAEAQRIARTRQAGIDLAKEALSMSPAEAMKQRDKNPLLAYLGGTKSGRGCAQMLASFGSSFPTEYDLLMRGKRSYFPMSSLPPELQKAMADATNGGLANAFKGMVGADMTPYQMVMTPAADVFDPAASEYIPDLLEMGMMVVTGLTEGEKPNPNAWMGGGNLMTLFPLMDGNTPLGQFAGKTLLTADSGISMDQLNKMMDEQTRNPEFLRDTIALPSPTEDTPPTDPDLTREVEIKDLSSILKPGMSQEQRIGAMVAEAARATGYPVLLESFRKLKPVELFVQPGKQPVYKLLIGLEKAGYAWTKDKDKTLRVRPIDWALRRSCEIPESYIAHYKEVLDKQGYMALDDVALMIAGLTDDQIHTQLSDDYLWLIALGRLVQDSSEQREMLRTYASFTPEQKSALNEEAGLPFADLTDEQWQHIGGIISDKMGGSYIADGSIRLWPQDDKAIQAKELKRLFVINVQVGDEKEPRKLYELIDIPSIDRITSGLANLKKAIEAALKAAEPTAK